MVTGSRDVLLPERKETNANAARGIHQKAIDLEHVTAAVT
jgi:hypothetical protein